MLETLLAEGPVTVTAAALFGLVSSAHCLGMCGGLAAAAGAGRGRDLRPLLLYCGGRLLSYALVGFVIGLTGSLLGLNRYLKALIPLLSGLVTVFIGLRQLGAFRWLSMTQTAPERCPAARMSRFGPLAVGLLTGVMPCGTLQTVQYAALSSGSGLTGAGILLAFALCSTPALAAAGALSRLLSARGRKWLTILSALIILFMGVRTVLKGLRLMEVI